MKPTICCVVMARDEERDLPRALRSIESFADHLVVLDTGSTDRTPIVAQTTIDVPTTFEVYTDASEPDPNAPDGWRITNFAKARNRALELGEAAGTSHIFWFDSDDVIETPMAVKRAAYLPRAAIGMWIELDRSGVRQLHHRMWPADAKIRFTGWCHEYAGIDKLSQIVCNDICIRHYSEAHASGENSNARNLRILTAEYAAEPNARTAFYLANTHKDAGRWQEAAQWYHTRLGYGDAFRDEYVFSVLYLGRCLRALGRFASAESAVQYGLSLAGDWQEFRMDLAFLAYYQQRYATAIDEASKALKQPAPQTMLWREASMYSDQPARLISWCHEHLGNVDSAIVWAELAAEMIGREDGDWNVRRTRLRAQRLAAINPAAPAIVTGIKPMIALHRPGAIGDILMTLNLLPALREANPDAEIHYYCSAALAAPDALGSIIVQAGADAVMDCAQLPAWRKSYQRVVDLVAYPMAEGYPYKPMRQHLLRYFAEEMGLTIDALPQLSLPLPRRFDGLPDEYATIQVKAGWSPYKNWPASRWQDVVNALPFPVIQIGGDGEPLLKGIADRFYGALSRSIGVFANARMHMGVDSWPNHASNYLWLSERGARRVPAVVLWGSTQPSAAGYVDNANLCANLECSPCFRESAELSQQRTDPCPHLVNGMHPCMDKIEVDDVIAAAMKMWERA